MPFATHFPRGQRAGVDVTYYGFSARTVITESEQCRYLRRRKYRRRPKLAERARSIWGLAAWAYGRLFGQSRFRIGRALDGLARSRRFSDWVGGRGSIGFVPQLVSHRRDHRLEVVEQLLAGDRWIAPLVCERVDDGCDYLEVLFA